MEIARLLQTKLPVLSIYGGGHFFGWNGSSRIANRLIIETVGHPMRCAKSTIKVLSWYPKAKRYLMGGNRVSTKGSNSYVEGGPDKMYV